MQLYGTPARCSHCHKWLVTLHDFRGCIEIQCPRCKVNNRFVRTDDGSPIDQQARNVRAEIEAAVQAARKERILTVMRQAEPSLGTDEALELIRRHWEEVESVLKSKIPTVPTGLRFEVFRRDGFRCRYCGRSAAKGATLHADHVLPRSQGGPTTLDNLVTACQDCNLAKHDQILSDAELRALDMTC